MRAQSATHDAGRRVPLDSSALEKVATEGIEVAWDDVKGLATPLAARVPVQVCHHPHLVMAHPDMSLTLGNTPGARAAGIALGAPSRFPGINEVTRHLHRGYLPVLESQWERDGLRLQQTVFCDLPRDPQVTTGTEVQQVIVRLNVTNLGTDERQVPLFFYLGLGGDNPLVNYGPFSAPVSRWTVPPLTLSLSGSALMASNRVILVFRAEPSSPPVLVPSMDAGPTAEGKPLILNNALRFDLRLKKGENRKVDLVLADTIEGVPPSQRAAMQAPTFDSALARAVKRWDNLLAPAMRLVTPDPRLNDIYKTLILSSLALQFRDPTRGWNEPRQWPIWGVWSWECAHLAVPLISIGHHRELEPSLRYFIERQNGLGSHSANTTPRGNIKSTRGSFTGDTGAHNLLWMNETGAILWTLAEKYRYSRDANWLKANWPSIRAAWDWIQRERQQTRVTDDQGRKVRYWGLLPAGMPGDINAFYYQFTFNDNVSWLGMSQVALAAREAGLSEAEQLTREAEEYRQCILDTIHREEYVDEATGLPFVPNMVFYRESAPDKRDPYWCADGPVQLFDTGLLHPTDKRFAAMVEYTRRTSGILLGMAEHIGGGDEWYPNQTERSYFRSYLARGEVEKALLVLFSNLTYGMASDTYQTTERFHVNDPNFTAFEPNASGNGRNLDMLRRMVIDEQDPGKLWLLRGCPRRWFAEGQSIAVENATTLFGALSIRTQSKGSRITIDVHAPDREIPETMTLVVRPPKDRLIKTITLNGQPVTFSGENIMLPPKKGVFRVIVQCAGTRP